MFAGEGLVIEKTNDRCHGVEIYIIYSPYIYIIYVCNRYIYKYICNITGTYPGGFRRQ